MRNTLVKNILSAVFLLATVCSFAQITPPPIAWQKTYERTGWIDGQRQDGYYTPSELHKTPSGGFVASGHGFSVSSNFRGIILYDSLGNITKEKNFNEIAGNYSMLNNFIINKVTPLADGSYIAAGKTNVSNGVFTGITPVRGKWDAFVLKLDDTLGIEWLKRYGGPEDDEFADIIPVAGGGYIAVGATRGVGGDVTQKRDSAYIHNVPSYPPPNTMTVTMSDWWVVKLDNAGDILQEKCFGSNEPYDVLMFAEISSGVLQLSGGDFIVTGISNGSDLDITNPIPFQMQNNTSYWVIRINNNLDIVWNKSIGGSSLEQIGSSILEMPDGNIIISGNSSFIDGDMDGLGHGGGQYVFDVYIAKLDASNGNVLWSNCYGGDDYLAVNTAPYAHTRVSSKNIVKTPDNNIAFVATTNDDGTTGNTYLGSNDVWVVKVDATTGSIIWGKSYGGSTGDVGYALVANDDGSYIVLGNTHSTDIDLHGQRYPQNNSVGVTWLFKLAPCDDSSTIHREICAGDTFDFNGTPLTEAGVYYDTTGNQFCSYYQTLYLAVKPAFQPVHLIQAIT